MTVDTAHTASLRNSVSRLLRPRSVAIVGASSSPGSLAGNVLSNLRRFGFDGDLHLINPKRSEIDGRRCLASINELPMGVDCAVLAIPSSGVPEAAAACGQRGIGGLVIFSSGFAEAGAEGRGLQSELARIARMHGMAIEGPNCLGMVNYVDGIPLTFSVGAFPAPQDGRAGLALVSQSGAMTTVLRTSLSLRDVRLSFSISTGNEAVNGVEDFLEFVLEHEAVCAIAMIVEQFRNPKRFLQLARRAREAGKPIVLLHPGRNAAARMAAQTHTGAMAGDYQVMRTLVAQEGVCAVDSLEELIDLAELLVRCPSLPRGGAAVMTDSGAHKALVLDLCETIGLDLPPLSPATEAALRAVLPDFIPVSNPLDITAQALVDPSLIRKMMEPLLADDRYGSLLLAVIISTIPMSKSRLPWFIGPLKELQPAKPVIFTVLGDQAAVSPELIAELRGLGVPVFGSPDRALRALGRMTEFARPASPCSAVVGAAVPAAERLPHGAIPEYLSKRILAEAGIPVPRGEFVSDLANALEAAARIGYPVALKAQSAALSHKSDAGGVLLRIGGPEALAAAWAKLHAEVARVKPGLVLDGVLVEAMARPGLEMILGARNDPDWGPVLMIGLGGVWAEALHDTRVLPPNLAPEAIAFELKKLKGAALLGGFRGSPAADTETMSEIASRLGAFILRRPEVTEIDINPVILYPQGEGAIAVDALMVTR